MQQNEQISKQPSETQIKRIDALTSAGRANWLVLLTYLAFVFITTLSVSDVEFFINDRQTQLPLIGVSIPTVSFFTFAPIVGAALFVYLHLHIRKVSEALASPPPGDPPLEERIRPWLLNDFILRKRLGAENMPDGLIRARVLDRLADLTTLVLVWWSGPFVLVVVWERTWSAHLLWLSLICGAALIVTIYTGVITWTKLQQDIGKKEPIPNPIIFVVTALLTVAVGWLTAANSKGLGAFEFEKVRPLENQNIWPLKRGAVWLWNVSISLAEIDPINLIDVRFTSRPSGWKSCPNAKKDFRQEFADRESLSYSSDWGVLKTAEFHDEWITRRRNQILEVETIDLSGADLRMADFSGAFGVGLRLPSKWWEGANFSPSMLEGSPYFDHIECQPAYSRLPLAKSDLRGIRLHSLAGVDLRNANLEGADLSNSNLTQTKFESTRLSRADLSGSVLEEAEFYFADLFAANLSETEGSRASFSGANLQDAQLQNAEFEGSHFSDADLQGTNMVGANLTGAWLIRTQLAGANMAEVDLKKTKIRSADFLFARVFGSPQSVSSLHGAVIEDVKFEGTAFRYIDFSQAIFGMGREDLLSTSVDASGTMVSTPASEIDVRRTFQNSFGDATAILPSEIDVPCQWANEVLSEEEYYARWYGWLNLNQFGVRWDRVAPTEWHDIEPQAPDDPSCIWRE